jgi:hypothetical protein
METASSIMMNSRSTAGLFSRSSTYSSPEMQPVMATMESQALMISLVELNKSEAAKISKDLLRALRGRVLQRNRADSFKS